MGRREPGLSRLFFLPLSAWFGLQIALFFNYMVFSVQLRLTAAFILMFSAAVLITQLAVSNYKGSQAFRQVCSIVDRHFVFQSVQLNIWHDECRTLARELPLGLTKEEVLYEIQNHLNQLGVSHLYVYTPAQDRRLWQGEATDTGIRVRGIDGYFVVSKIIADSAADAVGMKAGDIILSINGTHVISPSQVQYKAGSYLVKRGDVQLEFGIDPSPLKIDSSPELYDLGEKTGLLEVSSFRKEYFEEEVWVPFLKEVYRFDSLIIDLRDNIGGNVVSMLRLLSPFFCSPQQIGILRQPAKNLPVRPFDNKIDDQYQIRHLQISGDIPLVTFPVDQCFKGRVLTLVNSHTASVSEMFASGIAQRERSWVVGQGTAGDVLLAVWYRLPVFGEGYSLSVPEAVFENRSGKIIEGIGVSPSEFLFYELEDALNGEDTWINRAFKLLSQRGALQL